MALIKLGTGIAGISGKIGGTVFAKGRSGTIARAWRKPVNGRSVQQQVVRTIIAQLAQDWHNLLTDANRSAWETYAQAISVPNRLGEMVHITGFNMFVRFNSIYIRHPFAEVKPGPTTLALPTQDSTFAVAGSAATQLLSITFDNTQDWAKSSACFLTVFMGRPKLITRNQFNGPWKRAGDILEAGTPPTSPQTLAAPMTLVAGQKVFVYARAVLSDGRVSNPFRASCTVGA